MSAFLIAVCFLSTTYVQRGIDSTRPGVGSAEELMYLPDAAYVKVASIGYEQLSADFLWLKAIQVLGKFRMLPEECDWSYDALDKATALDPYFVEAYELGGLILTLNEDKTYLANRLLEKGVKYNPDVWQLQYYLGFNYYYFMDDYDRAAIALTRAAEMEGSPWYLPQLAARVSASAGKPEFAMEFLQRMYGQVEDERLKNRYLERINQLKSVILSREIQKAVDIYTIKTGNVPGSFEPLVKGGFLAAVPADPAGGKFYLDEEGKVRSTVVMEGVGVHVNPVLRKKK